MYSLQARNIMSSINFLKFLNNMTCSKYHQCYIRNCGCALVIHNVPEQSIHSVVKRKQTQLPYPALQPPTPISIQNHLQSHKLFLFAKKAFSFPLIHQTRPPNRHRWGTFTIDSVVSARAKLITLKDPDIKYVQIGSFIDW